MLSIVLMWIYVSFLCGGIGWIAVRCAMQFAEPGGSLCLLPLSIFPFIGLAIISAATAFISLLAPISWLWNLLFVVMLMAGIFIFRSDFKVALLQTGRQIGTHWLAVLFVCGCGSVLLLKSACVVDLYGTGESVFHSDTGYYHAQSIRWIEEYGVVPGLGNLLTPLAIDYLWFQPCALFSFAAFLPQRLHALGGLLVLWGMVYALGGVLQFLSKKSADWGFSDIYRTLLFIPLFEVGNYVVSDSGDDPAAVMVLISIGSALQFLEKIRNQTNSRGGCSRGEKGGVLLLCTTVLLSLFTVGIKLSALPLLVLVALVTIPLIWRREWQQVGAILLICACVLVPKLIRSVILSGYLLYPLASLDLFKFDWKMPASVLISEKAAVASMARIRFSEPGTVLNGGMEAWFYPWLLKFVQAPVVIALIGSLLIFLAGIFFFRKSLFQKLMLFWRVYLTVAIGLVYWFIMAPDVRFGFGFLAAASLLLCVPVICPALEKMSQVFLKLSMVKPVFAVVALFLLTGMLFSTPRPMPGDSFGRGVVFSQYYPLRLKRVLSGNSPARFLVYQDSYPAPEMLRLRLGNMEINRPKRGMHCWDSPLPSTPFLYNRIEMRGETLKQGFRSCSGSIDGFSGFRLQEEWKEAQQKAKEPELKKIP